MRKHMLGLRHATSSPHCDATTAKYIRRAVQRMDHAIYLVTLIGTALVLVAAFSSLIAFRYGAPLLLLFLGIGLLAGTDGLGLDFDNAALAYFIGSLALAVILFDSGFGTPYAVLRQAALPAISLATIGVVVTAGAPRWSPGPR